MDQLRKFKSLNHSNNVAIPPNNSPLDGKNGNNNNNVNNNNNPLNTLLAERMKNEFPAIFQHISKLKQIVEQSISNEAKKTQAIDLVSTISVIVFSILRSDCTNVITHFFLFFRVLSKKTFAIVQRAD